MKKGRIYIFTRMIKFENIKVLLLGFYFFLLSTGKFAELAFIRLYKNIVNFSLVLRLIVLWLV